MSMFQIFLPFFSPEYGLDKDLEGILNADPDPQPCLSLNLNIPSLTVTEHTITNSHLQ